MNVSNILCALFYMHYFSYFSQQLYSHSTDEKLVVKDFQRQAWVTEPEGKGA
jgi:hypothetical protein